MKKQKFQPNFLFDDEGNKVGVFLDIKSYEALIEEVEDTCDIKRAEKIMAKRGKTHTLEEMENFFLKKSK